MVLRFWKSSGGGYFYDDVLEYRVWISPPRENSYFHYYNNYESAKEISDLKEYSKGVIVLVSQKEYISEPEKGVFFKVK